MRDVWLQLAAAVKLRRCMSVMVRKRKSCLIVRAQRMWGVRVSCRGTVCQPCGNGNLVSYWSRTWREVNLSSARKRMDHLALMRGRKDSPSEYAACMADDDVIISPSLSVSLL